MRFLALAVLGWAGVRAATLGILPGADGFTFGRTKPAVGTSAAAGALPPIAPTDLAGLAPAGLSQQTSAAGQVAVVPAAYLNAPMPRMVPVAYYPAIAEVGPARQVSVRLPPPRPRAPLTHIEPDPAPLFYSPIPQLDEWPLSRIASAALPARRSTTSVPQQSAPQEAVKARLDRLQLTAWALLRQQRALTASPGSLSSVGTLGGSQAGARLTYNFTHALAASLRTSSTIGRRGGEVALGVRYRPFRSIPVALTAERRQAIGRYGGGRSDFAMFLEGGVYQRPLLWGFELDGYAQAGVVGLRQRDLFVDGGATFTRPVFGRFAAGFGVWGAAQPGLYRVDAGPRVSMKVRDNMRVHLDWRQKLAGNAEPGSGPALTLAADF
jgi:hypothetical protein